MRQGVENTFNKKSHQKCCTQLKKHKVRGVLTPFTSQKWNHIIFCVEQLSELACATDPTKEIIFDFFLY